MGRGFIDYGGQPIVGLRALPSRAPRFQWIRLRASPQRSAVGSVVRWNFGARTLRGAYRIVGDDAVSRARPEDGWGSFGHGGRLLCYSAHGAPLYYLVALALGPLLCRRRRIS